MLEKLKTIEKLCSKSVIKLELNYLKICKFRQFSENSIVRFEHPLTILVGKNGSGKSTFLKLIKSIAKGRTPDDYFFETEWDINDKSSLEFQYKLNETEYRELRTKHFGWIFSKLENHLETDREIKDYLTKPVAKNYTKIIDIEFKSLIGAFEKNTFFDNQTSKLDLKKKSQYAKRVTKKVQQSIGTKANSGTKAKVTILSRDNIAIINRILGKNYDEIKVIKHRFFSGTWGTSIIFKSENIYSEANSGSGEFIISNIINKLSTIPNESLLLLDEPELSLHPGAQKRLLEHLLDLIIQKKIQVILSTHSQAFVELIPSKCIKNFLINKDDTISIDQYTNYLNAFDNLEISYNIPEIIVEDVVAKKLIEKIAINKKINNQIKVNFFSGGASSLKTSLITMFSKVGDENRFIIFDGDMFRSQVTDLSSIPEISKTIQFLENEIKKITGVNIQNFPFNVDGGKNGSNENQKRELYVRYINYFFEKVYFLPKNIPEDIFYDDECALRIFPTIDLKELNSKSNSKEKFKMISDQFNIPLDSLHDIFISNFITNKNQQPDYDEIFATLHKILSKSKKIQ